MRLEEVMSAEEADKMVRRFVRLVNVTCEALMSYGATFETCMEDYHALFGTGEAIELLRDEFKAFDEAIRAYVNGQSVAQYQAGVERIKREIDKCCAKWRDDDDE